MGMTEANTVQLHLVISFFFCVFFLVLLGCSLAFINEKIHHSCTLLMANAVKTEKNVCKIVKTLSHSNSTAEKTDCGLLLSPALYRKTTLNSRQEGNQYCRNQYNTQYLAILSQGRCRAMTSKPAGSAI